MEYEVVIGLEVHSELLTDTKIYCGCSTEFGGEQNAHCCPVCLGLPGSLPVLNKKVVDHAIKAGLALNCKINRNTHMARKNYFYPDCPKNYQITQDETPLCSDGYIEIDCENDIKKIRIHRIHIEEDAGKGLHREDGSYMDFNRAGVPLIEIVTEPDMRSSTEARLYLEKLKAILQYTEVSDCKMEEGSLRCDANVSIRPMGQVEFGVRTEVKNMNSFKAVEKALEFEIERQKKCIDNGEKVTQETRRWDDTKNETIVMRSKEEAHDYRYFPEPDMSYLLLSDEWIQAIRETIPELPHDKENRYVVEFELPKYDAEILTSTKALAEFFENCIAGGGNPKEMSNWIMGEILRTLKEKNKGIEDVKFSPVDLVKLVDLINKGTVSGTMAKKIFKEMFETGDNPEKIVKDKGLVQVSDENLIRDIVIKVLDDNTQSVEAFKNGKTNNFGFLVGQAMKASRGQANPQIINKLVNEELNRR